MSNQHDISSTGKGGNRTPLTPDELQAYMEGRLSPDRKHAVEEWLHEDGMEADALEGLQSISAHDAQQRVTSINSHVRRHLGTKRTRRRPVSGNRWTLLAIALILMLVLLGYMVLRMAQ